MTFFNVFNDNKLDKIVNKSSLIRVPILCAIECYSSRINGGIFE